MAFNVGDTVVYPAQGAGVIEEITTRDILGVTREYLRITFIRGDMDVLVPVADGEVSSEVRLRHTITVSDLDELYAQMLKGEMELPVQWPPRHRAEQEILTRGETFELASLIGTLAQRDTLKGLADTERDIMERAKEMLASELAVILDLSLDEARKRLNTKLEEAM